MRKCKISCVFLLTIPLLLSCYSSLRSPAFVAVRAVSHSSAPGALVQATVVNELGDLLIGTTVYLVARDNKTHHTQDCNLEGKALFKGVQKSASYNVLVSIPCKKKPILVGEFSIADQQGVELYICIPSYLCPSPGPA